MLYEAFQRAGYKRTRVRYKNRVINAEIADTIAKRGVGLMFRERMEANAGMLFLGGMESRTATATSMHNMKFGIDIIWMDSGKRIVDIARDAQPTTSVFAMPHIPRKAAKYVLELNAGTAKKLGIKIGDRLAFKT